MLTRDRGRDRDTAGGIYVGTVTGVKGATATVTIPRLADGFDFPARYPAELAPDAATDAAPVPGVDGSSHRHGLPPLAKGDSVAVAFLEGDREELVILIRLA